MSACINAEQEHPVSSQQSLIVRLAKAIRTSQPFNGLATKSLRSTLGSLGTESEWLIMHLPRTGTVSARLPNGRVLRFRTRGDDYLPNQIFWRGWDGFEPETTPILWHLASRARTVLDIGAHIGVMSLLAAHANPSASVFAFEPFRPVYSRLCLNAGLNKLTNLECLNLAAGDVNGTLELYYIDDSDGLLPSSTSMRREFIERSLEYYRLPLSQLRHAPVSTVTVDSFVESRGIDRVDLVKIDTESTEPSVIRGMLSTLRRDRPSIIVEILPGRSLWPRSSRYSLRSAIVIDD